MYTRLIATALIAVAHVFAQGRPTGKSVGTGKYPAVSDGISAYFTCTILMYDSAFFPIQAYPIIPSMPLMKYRLDSKPPSSSGEKVVASI
jgi:hypothetical protein